MLFQEKKKIDMYRLLCLNNYKRISEPWLEPAVRLPGKKVADDLVRGNSPLEKKDVLRPMHSVAGGEFGGANEEDDAAERYLVPFQITSLPSTVSRDSRKVLCRLPPPRLLDESLFEHSPMASTSSDDEARVSACERSWDRCWPPPPPPAASTSLLRCVFRRFFRFLRLLPTSSSSSCVEHLRCPSASLLLDTVVAIILVAPRRVVASVDSASPSQSFTLRSRDMWTLTLLDSRSRAGRNDRSRTRRLARQMRFFVLSFTVMGEGENSCWSRHA